MSGDLDTGQSYPETATARIPAILPGSYGILVLSDSGLEVSDSNRENNVASTPIQFTIPTLGSIDSVTETLDSGEQFFQVDVAPGTTVEVSLSTPNAVQLLSSRDTPPTAFTFDKRVFGAGSILLDGSGSGRHFILARATSDSAVGQSFTIQTRELGLELRSVAPDSGSNVGFANIELNGAGLDADSVVELISPTGDRLAAEKIQVIDSGKLNVRFNLQGLAPGSYDLSVTNTLGSSELQDAFEVTNAPRQDVEVQITTQAATARGRTSVAIIDYHNPSDAESLAPIIVVSAEQAGIQLALPGQEFSDAPVIVVGASQIGAAGILAPGERGTLEIELRSIGDADQINVNVEVLSETNEAASENIDWASRKSELQPSRISNSAWDVIYDNFLQRIGQTGLDTLSVISEATTHLGTLGREVVDFNQVLAFELLDAEGFDPAGELHTAIDIVDPAPGNDLIFARIYHGGIADRHEETILGRGWSHSWQRSVELDNDGFASVELGLGRSIRFAPLGGGQFETPDGFSMRLQQLGDGSFELVGEDLRITRYDSSGRLTQIEDPNGNTITANYTSDQLVSLQHSSGQFLDFAYNAEGHLISVSDSSGIQATYQYDAGEPC